MKFHFDCGLPRSGSTLLTAILNQNPQIHAGTLSPVFEVMYYTDDILKGEQAQAFPKPDIFRKMVRDGIITYYCNRDEPIIIDKCRAWPAHIDMLKKYVTDDPRIICTVRHPWESMNALATAFRQNQTQHIHFVQYDDLVNTPEKALQGIHSFLRMKPFEYDFDNIIAKDREKDKEVYGLETMHEVRPSIKKTSKHYSEVLSDAVINKYNNMDFWNR